MTLFTTINDISSINSDIYFDNNLSNPNRLLKNIQQQMALLGVMQAIDENFPVGATPCGYPIQGRHGGLPLQIPQKYLQTLINISKSSTVNSHELLQLAKQLDNDGQTMAALTVCALLNGEAGLVQAPQYIRDQAQTLKDSILLSVGAGFKPAPTKHLSQCAWHW